MTRILLMILFVSGKAVCMNTKAVDVSYNFVGACNDFVNNGIYPTTCELKENKEVFIWVQDIVEEEEPNITLMQKDGNSQISWRTQRVRMFLDVSTTFSKLFCRKFSF